MNAKDRSTRQNQQALTEQNLAQRTQLLTEQGKSEEQIARDSVVRKLKAKIRDAKNRIKSLEKYEGIIAQARQLKEEKALQVKDKSKKKSDKPAEEEKKSKTKKKHGEKSE